MRWPCDAGLDHMESGLDWIEYGVARMDTGVACMDTGVDCIDSGVDCMENPRSRSLPPRDEILRDDRNVEIAPCRSCSDTHPS